MVEDSGVMLRLLASHRHAAARFTAPSKNSAEFLSNLRLDQYTTTKKDTKKVPFLVVEDSGVEPLTSSMPWKRSTN